MTQLTCGSLFAGIGGFDLGFERAGIKTIWQVEINEYCRKVLARHFPDAERFGDIRECGAHNLKPVDIICGGFPCQDISGAGLQAGIDGERSGLWAEMRRIICELRPRFVLVENVAALLNRGMGRVLGDMAYIRYDAEWDCAPASAFGSPCARQRIFILAYPNSEHRKNRIYAGREFDKAWRETRLGQFGGMACPESWREAVSVHVRRDDGIPNRMERLTALGNAVVPQITEWIGRRIVEASNQRNSL